MVSRSVTWSPLLGLWGFKSGLKLHVLDTKHLNRLVDWFILYKSPNPITPGLLKLHFHWPDPSMRWKHCHLLFRITHYTMVVWVQQAHRNKAFFLWSNYLSLRSVYNVYDRWKSPNLGFIPVQTTDCRGQYVPFQFVYQHIEVVEENGLLQNGDVLNGPHTDTIMGQIQCCDL
jgi:hypothetical protein